MRLKGKVAIVTGSSRGIGRAIALRFAQEGADVVINYNKNSDAAEEAKREVEALGRRALVVQASVEKVADAQRLVAETVAEFGDLHILVNNAGVEVNAPFWEVTEKDYDTVMDVNLKGPFFTTQAAAKHMIDRKIRGRIINVSSVHEELPFPNFAAYCASKGGMKMLTRNLSVEMGKFGVTVNAIAPGAIKTEMNAKLLSDPKLLGALLPQIPMGRIGEPEDVAGVAAFLASDEAGYVSGSTYFVDGGLTWHYEEQ